MKKNVLLVDDEKSFIESLSVGLEDERLSLLQANTGLQAIAVMERNNIDLVVTDLKMPDMGGYELVAYLARNHPQIPVVVMSAYATLETEENFKILGVSSFVQKPLELDDLKQKMLAALDEADRTRGGSSDEIKLIHKKNIQLLANLVETRDPYTAGHQRRTAELSMKIAEQMTISPDKIQGLYMAALIHDIGKIAVPSEILTKPGRLTPIEFELIKNHPETAYDILKPIDFPWPVATIVRQHHERLDGSGYPLGIAGDEILLESAILTVSDVVEAMATNRPYRFARTIELTLEEITDHRGTYYLPEAVDACVSLFADGEFITQFTNANWAS
jgi:response regulator RpfG family c-di-GMP phosphodiesterase